MSETLVDEFRSNVGLSKLTMDMGLSLPEINAIIR